MDPAKTNIETIEHVSPEETPANSGGGPVMRSRTDDLGIWQSVVRFKVVSLVAMAASFSAALDGYRKMTSNVSVSDELREESDSVAPEINLNGGIVSNKGFIQQMATKGTTVIAGKYVSAWGGVQSAGQTVGQIFLQYFTERLGRKVAMYIIWVDLVVSIFIETFATRWDHWLVAKLFSGMGVGMLQSTMPLYLSEIAPTQLRGFFINAYSFWFVLGQIFASVALNRLSATDPYDFRTPIYTQWAMVGSIAIIFVFLPESPWWLVSKGKIEHATKALRICNGHVQDYNVQEQIEVMNATVAEERIIAERNSELGLWAAFRGRNLIRFIIAGWPKIAQQFVGLSVFNTYVTYFFQNAGNANPFQVTIITSCVQLISMILTATLTDHLGRRPLTIYPYAVTVLSVLCLGVIGCFDYTSKSLSSLLIFFACLATFSTTGASAIGYAYAAEIPQQRLRAQTAGLALALSNGIATMFSFCTPLMINGTVTKWGVKTGFFFAGTGAVAVVIAWFILPEVTRRTPAEIDEMFEKKVNLREFKEYVTEVQMRADEQHQEKMLDDMA